MGTMQNLIEKNGDLRQTPNIKLNFSSLEKNSSRIGSGRMGRLIPVFTDWLIPNQTVRINNNVSIQFQQMIDTVNQNITGKIHTYIVPLRLIYDKFEDWATGGRRGDFVEELPESITYKKINKTLQNEADAAINNLKAGALSDGTITEDQRRTCIEQFKNNIQAHMQAKTGVGHEPFKNSLYDYFGFPFKIEETNTMHGVKGYSPNQMLWRAYWKIINDHFINLDFEEEMDIVEKDDITREEYNTPYITNWGWDYITRARAFITRGAVPSIPISLGDIGINATMETYNGSSVGDRSYLNVGDSHRQGLRFVDSGHGTTAVFTSETAQEDNEEEAGEITITGTLDDDGKGGELRLEDIMINQALYRVLANNAKIKPKYREQLKVRWGIIPQDARFQIAEWVGTVNLNISGQQIFNTGENQGNIVTQAWGNEQPNSMEVKANEHCIIMSLLEIKPVTIYEQGLDIKNMIKTRWDMPMPEFVNLPDVPIKNYEVNGALIKVDKHGRLREFEDYLSDTNFKKDDYQIDRRAALEVQQKTFGYKAIYDEYRSGLNIVTGDFRPSVGTRLYKTYARCLAVDGNSKEVIKMLDIDNISKRVKINEEQDDFDFIVRTNIKTALPLPLLNDPANILGL